MPLNIFVHSASECLTDHESHGDGLICHSILSGLAERGHTIHAYTMRDAVAARRPGLQIRSRRHTCAMNSLAPWEHALRANAWLRELRRSRQIDLVWRMHPYYHNCPMPPRTLGLPLVVGPIFYPWPKQAGTPRPRFGLSVYPIVRPLATCGWTRTLRGASAVFCATAGHAQQLRPFAPRALVSDIPIIIDTPAAVHGASRRSPGPSGSVVVAFVANLSANKQPRIFCDIVARLRDATIDAKGIVIGDGPDRAELERYCRDIGIGPFVEFVGRVPNSDVFERLRDAHFLVSTSLGEPYGRCIVEGMALGIPAVCHRSGGPAEYIVSGVDGILVDRLDADSYADRIRAVLSGDGIWEALSAAALRRSRSWSKELVLSQIEHTLNAVVSRSVADPVSAAGVVA